MTADHQSAATYDGASAGVTGGAEALLIETPMPGDAAFSAWASQKFASIARWENPRDVVPDAPGRWNGYFDLAGDPVPIDMGPLNLPAFDILKPFVWLANQHHLPNCIRAFCISNGLSADSGL